MMSSIYVGEEYLVDPRSIRFDTKMIEFNRTHTKEEYESTKLSIAGPLGQQAPIAINNITGLCENGRHRVKICIELGIDVKCIQVDGGSSDVLRLELYNMDQMSGRELTTAQKAVQAHKYIKLTGEPLKSVAKKYRTNERAVNAANTISGLGREDILRAVELDGQWTSPKGRTSKDLRRIATDLKAEVEELEDIDEGISIDYVDMINTEKGKSEYWRIRTLVQLSGHELNKLLVDHMNLLYKLKVDNVTGEVKDG